MAMQKTLWSISGLATELNRDRRTVARALDGVPANGRLGRHPAWYLDTALRALKTPIASPDPEHPLTAQLLDRLEHWQDQEKGLSEERLFSVSEVAALLDVYPDDVLQWLRSGMPFAARGKLKDGNGFALRIHWVIDWIAFVSLHLRNAGRPDLEERFRLPG